MVDALAPSQGEGTLSILRLLTNKPQLLLMHADAYSDLMGQEIKHASSIWRNRLLFVALALLLFGVAGVLGGVALMFWFTMPVAQVQPTWLFWLIPAVPTALALLCMLNVRLLMQQTMFVDLQEQVRADMSLLREVSGTV